MSAEAVAGEALREQLLAAVTAASDPAAAAAAVLASASRQQVARPSRAGSAGALHNACGAGRRGSGSSSALSGGGAACGSGGDAMDPWDSRMLQMLVDQVQNEARRAEIDLAEALQRAGAL